MKLGSAKIIRIAERNWFAILNLSLLRILRLQIWIERILAESLLIQRIGRKLIQRIGRTQNDQIWILLRSKNDGVAELLIRNLLNKIYAILPKTLEINSINARILGKVRELPPGCNNCGQQSRDRDQKRDQGEDTEQNSTAAHLKKKILLSKFFNLKKNVLKFFKKFEKIQKKFKENQSSGLLNS